MTNFKYKIYKHKGNYQITRYDITTDRLLFFTKKSGSYKAWKKRIIAEGHDFKIVDASEYDTPMKVLFNINLEAK